MAGVSTGLVIAGLGISAIGTGASFLQAGKQRKAEKKASKAAAAALEEARKRLSVNYMDALSLPMEPREYLNDQMLQQGANIIGAAQEGERGVGEQAGRIYAQQQDAAEALRAQTSMDLFNIQEKQLNKDSELMYAQANLDIAEAEGAQAAAAQAADAANMATAQGIQGAANTAMLAVESAKLYKKGAPADKGQVYTPQNMEAPLNLTQRKIGMNMFNDPNQYTAFNQGRRFSLLGDNPFFEPFNPLTPSAPYSMGNSLNLGTPVIGQ
jgi:hypothetical protein